jgi:pyrimidine-specific ribonucleoside hydrolase
MFNFKNSIVMRYGLIGILVLLCLVSEAHSGKARFHVLIDTDGAADDLRAVCMLLGNREVEVLAVTTSEGALIPSVGARKVAALLHCFHHGGIPAGVGRALDIRPPMWRSQSENINWGGADYPDVSPLKAKDVIIRAIEQEEERVIFLCLGTLTNLSDVLAERPDLKEHIEQVIWYNSSAQPLKGANYDADRVSANNLLTSGITIRMVSGSERQPLPIDTDYLNMISKIDQPYARLIVETHNGATLKPVVASKHMQAWDDLTVVYLFAPELFDSIAAGAAVSFHRPADVHALEQVKQTIVQILAGKPDSESRVFFGFPENPALYADDVAPIAQNMIARHGHSEWRAGVLANELHGHLGIYAIVGVKMGIRAREYFNIGVDDIAVTSYAGSTPPVSCLNDGLQVSTGATIGHGLIRISTEPDIRPEATFTFRNETLRIRLKQKYVQQIREDVAKGIRLHGNLTEAYWQYIRKLAIRYWQEFDRHEMFEWE